MESSTIAQGGATQLGREASVGALNLAGLKLGKDASLTIQTGPSEEMLQDLVGNLSSANAAQIAAVTSGADAAASGLTEQVAALTGLVREQTATQSGGVPQSILWLIGLAFGGFVLLAFTFRK